MVLKAFEMSTCNTNRFSHTVEHSTCVWITCSTPSGTLHPTWTGTNLGTTVCWASLQATLATSRRNVSPEAIGRTLPCGLEKAYNVAARNIGEASEGSYPAKLQATKADRVVMR